MNHVITTYGGGELFTLIFNAIATLFKEGEAGMLTTLMRIGLMVGSVYVVVLMLFKNQLFEGIKWFLWVIIATHLLFLPKTTVWIHDPLTKAHNKVDGVPVALGIFAGFVSTVGKTVTESFESVFSLPDDFRYHKTGTVFASSLMSQLGQFRIVDPTFKSNMERFINQCVVYDAMIGHKYTLTELQNEKDIWTFVSGKASPLLGFLYKEDKNPGVIITCKEGAQKLNTLWKGEIEKATLTYGSRVQNQTLTKTLFFSHLQNGYELMAGIAKSAEDLLKQEIMINAIEESSNNKLSELGVPSNYAATKALLQQRSAYAVAGEIAAKTLPLFKNVIEALSYALFIFIVVLALLPNGYRILLTYFGILVWTQLWAPLYAVLNLVMTLYGKSETTSLVGNSGLTLLNSSAIVNANADMVTLAAWLSVSIPFISYGILKQGAGAFVGLAQHLGSAMQSAASSAAAETVSGNISLGNVSMGNQAYQNTSAFQHNTSPTYNASQFKSMDASGVEQSTFADGTQVFNDHAMSHLSVQIMGTENTSFAEQKSLSHARNLAETKSTAASQAMEAAIQNSTNFLSRFGSEEFKGEDFSKTLNASQSESLQNFKNHIHDICQKTGLDETQAIEAVIGASIGSPKLLGIGASGNFSSTAARQQAIHDATSIAAQTGYSENTEKILSAAQAFTEGTRDTAGAELGKSAASSLNTAKSLREEAMIAHNTVDSISRDMSSSQSKGITISKELTQEVLEFIAHQSTNPGPDGSSGGEIGYKEARRILENGGDERASYLKGFQEAHPEYTIQTINVAGAQSALQSQYETQAQHHKNHAGIQAQHRTNTQDVQHQANAAGFNKAGLEPRLDQTHLDQASLDQAHLSPASPDQTRSDQESLRQTSLNKTNFDQINLGKTHPDQKGAESPQKERESEGAAQSIKSFVEQQFVDTSKKIEVGSKEIGKKEEHLQTAERSSQEKTLGVTTVKNLVGSAVDGVVTTGKDVAKAIEELPPPPSTYFP